MGNPETRNRFLDESLSDVWGVGQLYD